MKNAIWFSPDPPTLEQWEEISERGFDLVEIGLGMERASRRIEDDRDASRAVESLVSLAQANNAEAVFGVAHPAIIEHGFDLNSLHPRDVSIPFYTAWLTSNMPSHRKWVKIGWLVL